MKRIPLVLIGAVFLTSCINHEMKVQDLDQDLPTKLVAEYNSSNKPYVDEGTSFNLLLLSGGTERVWKTTDGFNSREVQFLGLGVLYAYTSNSRFDTEGRILRYEYEEAILLGLLQYSKAASVRKDYQSQWKHSSSSSTLWGLIGREHCADGSQITYLFWIPIRH